MHKETITVTSLEIIFLLWEKGVYEETSFHTLRNFWIITKKKKKKEKITFEISIIDGSFS